MNKSKLKQIEFTGRYVLAIGEHTGHKHVLTAEKDAVRLYKDEAGNMVLEILGKAILTHEEHKEIELQKGWYTMGHEREFDYYLQSVSRVID